MALTEYDVFIGENFHICNLCKQIIRKGILNKVCMENKACFINLKFRCLGNTGIFYGVFRVFLLIFKVVYYFFNYLGNYVMGVMLWRNYSIGLMTERL